MERVLRQVAATKKPDVIFGDAFGNEEAVRRVANQFPKIAFVFGSGEGPSGPNVSVFDNWIHEPAYLSGLIAGKMTKSNTVGFVGGAEIPPTVQAGNAFAAGAKSVNPNIKVLKNIVGDFNDVAKGKAATAAMITDGADVVYPFLDAGIAGAYAAGKASGKDPAMFKITIPDCTSYDNIVGTGLVNNLAATSVMLKKYTEGTLKPGAIFLDLQNPKLQTMQLCPKYQKNATVAKATKDTIDGVNSGKIKLPANAINPRPSYQYQEGFEGPVQNANKSQ
jgi:basic membrane lipoprotein Med (substrate-binding protein (PBP1-ABC) superfamily)